MKSVQSALLSTVLLSCASLSSASEVRLGAEHGVFTLSPATTTTQLLVLTDLRSGGMRNPEYWQCMDYCNEQWNYWCELEQRPNCQENYLQCTLDCEWYLGN